MSDILGVNNPDDNPLMAHGMTLRDFFAAHVINAVISGGTDVFSNPLASAEDAYIIADAMLRARSK